MLRYYFSSSRKKPIVIDMLHVFAGIVFLLLNLISLTSFASEESPQTFTLDGRLYSDSAATIPLVDIVSLKVQILDPAQTCIVYEEVQSVNTTSTSGYYTIQIGQKVTPPAGKRSSGDSNNGLTTIFSNSVSSITGKLLSDGTTVCTYNPTAGDTRFVKFTMTPAGDNIARTTTSNLRLDSVPMALVAERAENLRGLTPSQLLQVNGTTASLTQANIENIFSTLNYPNLVSLLSTAPANYVLKNSNGSTNIPSVAGAPGSGLAVGQIWYDSTNNQLKYYDGAVKVVGSSTAGTLAATAGGTGQSSFAVGDLLYANTTTALARLPASTSGYVLTSNGAGTAPSWQAAAGGGGSLSSTTAATTTNSIDNANFAQTWNWNSATTESPLTLTSNAITTGSILRITSSSAGINSTSGLLNVANSTATTTGTLARFQANSTAGSGFTILNSGNVGIGTSNPSQSLTVAGTTMALGTGFVRMNTNEVLLGNSNSIGTGGGISMGIGNYSAYTSIAIGRSNGTSAGSGSSAIGISNNANWDNSVAMGISNTSGAMGAVAIGRNISNSISGSLQIGASDASKLTILSSGNVGIGTTSPASLLDASSSTGAVQTLSRNNATVSAGDSIGKIQFWNNDTQLTTQKVFANIEVESSQTVTTDAAAGNMIFRTTSSTIAGAPVERMRLDSSGNIGIGTATPTEKIDVNGAIKLGTTTGTNAGSIRWDGTNFSGYNGAAWVNFVPNPPAGSACDTTTIYSTAGTYAYTVPASFGTITVRLWGAGGGSGGSSTSANGGTGQTSSIASLSLFAPGGAGGGGGNVLGFGGAGGVASGGSTNINGSAGTSGISGAGGDGGASPNGGVAKAGATGSSTGSIGNPPGGGASGGGYTGGGGYYGGGGGGGAFVEKTYTSATLPPGTYLSDMIVGSGGTAGTTGATGGGAGAAGQISITCATAGQLSPNDRGILFWNAGSHDSSANFVHTATGDVGVGTASPSQKLEVNGGLRLNTGTAKPTCDSTSRGTFWMTQGGPGAKDSVEVCAKDAADSYAWRTLY